MKEIREKIFSERSYRVKELKIKAEALKKICEGLIDKIDQDGIDSNYSVNVDASRIANDINDVCRSLYFLSVWEKTFDEKEREKIQDREDLRGQDFGRSEDSREDNKD